MRKLHKPVAKKKKVVLYGFGECSKNGTFGTCGLRW